MIGFYDLCQDWANVRPQMLEAIELTAGEWTEDMVLVGIRTEKFKYWRTGNSAVITEIGMAGQMKCLFIMFAGGELKDLLPLRERLLIYKAENGCQRIKALFCREGWARILGEDAKIMGIAAYRD